MIIIKGGNKLDMMDAIIKIIAIIAMAAVCIVALKLDVFIGLIVVATVAGVLKSSKD